MRDHLNLRTEPATNNVADYGVKKAVENLPQLRQKMASIIDNYLDVQQDILETFLDRGQLRKLAELLDADLITRLKDGQLAPLRALILANNEKVMKEMERRGPPYYGRTLPRNMGAARESQHRSNRSGTNP